MDTDIKHNDFKTINIKQSKQNNPNKSSYVYESCLCNNGTDKRLYVLSVQTIISLGLLSYSAIMLSSNIECERSTIFSSMITLILGWWFPSPTMSIK